MTDEYKFIITGKDATKRAFMSINKGLGSVRAGINSTQLKMGVLAGAAGMGAMIAKSLASGDALGKFADRVGATTEGLAGLQLITKLNGESAESLSKSLEKMRRGIGEADRGIGTAKDGLKELGISLDDIRDLSADEQFIKIGSAIGELTDKNKQATLASDIFGRSGVKLINTFQQGEDAMRASREEAERLGIAISRTDAAKLEAANDAILRATEASNGLATQVTIAVAPVIEELANQFASAGLSSEEMSKVISQGMEFGAKWVGTFSDGVRGVQVIFKASEIAARGFIAAGVSGFVTLIEAGDKLRSMVTDGILWPFKQVLQLLAPFNEKAAEALAGFDELANGFKINLADGMQDFAAAQSHALSVARTELHELMMQELPSAIIDQKLKEILESAQVRAEEIAAIAGARLDSSQTGGNGDVEATAQEAERIQSRLDRLNESYFTELEMLQSKYSDEQTLLQDSLENKLISEDKFQALNLRATKKYEKQKSQIERAAADARRAQFFGSMKSLVSGFAGQSKTMFKLQKNLALAEAVVTLPSSVLKSYHNAGGYPLGIPAGIAMAATGLKNIQTIRSTSLGGGGGSVSLSGGGGSGASVSLPSIPQSNGTSTNLLPSNVTAANDDDQTSARPEIHFHFPEGVVFGSDAEKNLADIKRLIVEEDYELVPADSRNGRDLAAGAV